MKIYVLSRAQLMKEKVPVGVYATPQLAEKALRSKFPYAKKNEPFNSFLITPRGEEPFLMFISGVDILDKSTFPEERIL